MTKSFLVLFVSIKTPFLIAFPTKRMAAVIRDWSSASYAITNLVIR